MEFHPFFNQLNYIVDNILSEEPLLWFTIETSRLISAQYTLKMQDRR